MLQQILQQMYVDPELLEKLSDDDRRHLFGKMREEQVRRWNSWQEDMDREDKVRKKPRLPPKPRSKKVQFMLGSDGNPWTWVIDDVSPSATTWTSAPPQSPPPQHQNLGYSDDGQSNQSASIPCQLLRCHTKDLIDVRGNVSPTTAVSTSGSSSADEESEDREVRATLSRARLLARILEQNSVDNERTSWLKRKQDRMMTRVGAQVTDGRSQPATCHDDPSLSSSKEEVHNGPPSQAAHNKSMDIERSLRQTRIDDAGSVVAEKTDLSEIAEMAWRSRATMSANCSMMTSKNKRNNLMSHGSTRMATLPITRTRNRPLKPPSREAIVEWFRSEERLRGTGWDAEHRCVEPWFHGMVSRQEAEDMLADQPKGTFLVRFCERIWGYAVSYRGAEKCKHYLIDASNDHYRFLGDGFKKFKKFADLVRFYQCRSFVPNDRDCLTRPCPKTNNEQIANDFFS